MKEYKIREIMIIVLLIWCWTLNSKTNSAYEKIEILSNQIEELEFDLEVQEVELKRMQRERDDFNNLAFSEAFKVMYDTYGVHHLFEWRGRVYTTDLKELRNITITPAQEGAIND